MIHLKQTIIVEGKYDKIRLSNFIDAYILTTNGFEIFKNPQKQALIRKLALKDGIIVMTDSDKAGRQIRSYIKSIVTQGSISFIYLPQILGKEPRKNHPSKEGFLGVEGMPDEIIKDALYKAGIIGNFQRKNLHITKADFMEYGLSGRKNSYLLRKKVCRQLHLPENISANELLEIINSTLTVTDFLETIKKITEKENEKTNSSPVSSDV